MNNILNRHLNKREQSFFLEKKFQLILKDFRQTAVKGYVYLFLCVYLTYDFLCLINRSTLMS